MKIHQLLALTSVLFGFTCFGQSNQLTLELSWRLESSDTNIIVPAVVPGCVHLDLLASGIISDPFYGNNEASVQWISEKSWTYISEPFSIDSSILNFKNLNLQFNCLDTYAKVWLNDVHILSANNYFRQWHVQAETLLLQDGNVLKIEFQSPLITGQKLVNTLKHALPGEAIRAVTRKPQFHYGWDWGPKLTTSGIQGDINLCYSNGATIENVWLKQTPIENGSTRLQCFTEIKCQTPFYGELEVEIGGFKVSKSVAISAGLNTVDITIVLPESFPKWWPAGYGDQVMHELSYRLKSKEGKIDDKEVLFTGIRSIELINENDSLGTSFFFKVNGQPIFMKGANYIPQDIFQTRVVQNDYKKTLQAAKDCGMNMIRVWGGGIYESEKFYSLCDSLGILVWQDFMFACAMYPGNKEFIQNVEEEAQFQVKRLSPHPCMAIWCGNNESSEGWHRWGWQNNLGFMERRKVWRAYQCLFQDKLSNTVASFSSIPYWESSPSLGRGDPQHQFEGDAHYWGVWHDAEPFENFELKVPRFMSEFGFQSFPSMLSINSFSEPSDHSLENPKILAHEKHSRGVALINEYMLRDFGVIPDKFEDYVILSQFVQAEGMRKGIDAHRIAQPYCMGTLYWQLNDCWPAASWSSIDDLGIWKPLQWIAKNSFQPTQLMFEIDSLQIKGYLIGDRGIDKGHPLQFVFKLISFSGETIYEETLSSESDGSCSQEIFLKGLNDFDGLELNNCFAQMNLVDRSIQLDLIISTYLIAPKYLKIQPSNIELSQVNHGPAAQITIRTETYVPRVWLFSDVKGTFSHNYFPLFPGQEMVVQFTSETGDKGTIRAKTMNDFIAD